MDTKKFYPPDTYYILRRFSAVLPEQYSHCTHYIEIVDLDATKVRYRLLNEFGDGIISAKRCRAIHLNEEDKTHLTLLGFKFREPDDVEQGVFEILFSGDGTNMCTIEYLDTESVKWVRHSKFD